MVTSMTGFGRGTATSDGVQVTVEVKTLNSRYLDVSSRLPTTLSDKELEFKEIVQKFMHRGKVNLSVNIDRSGTERPTVTFSEERVRGYGKLLEQIRFHGGIKEPIRLSDLLNFNEIFQRREDDEETVEALWELTRQACSEALEVAQRMRENEGTQLERELKTQINGIESHMSEIREIAKKRAPEALERFRERVRRLLSDEAIDAERMEQEMAILVDKMDIQEEVIRLESHVKYFREALDNREPIGRRLNFLCQEINRELNTIGSKANDSEISHLIVEGKERLEQIREQVQNIE